MQNLHRDLAALGMDSVRHNPVVRNIFGREQPRRTGKHTALAVRGHAACHDQCGLPARAFCIELRDTWPILGFFQTRVHGPHQHAIFQRDKAQVQRCQHMRIGGHVYFSPPVCARLSEADKAVTPNAASWEKIEQTDHPNRRRKNPIGGKAGWLALGVAGALGRATGRFPGGAT